MCHASKAVVGSRQFDTTVQRNIFWDHHDGGITGDDDYNVKITTPAITGASPSDPLALVAESNSDIEGFRGTLLVKGEFDSDETVDQDGFNAIPWWRDFHAAVDDSDEAARAKINGHFAIMTGLAGLDLAACTATFPPLGGAVFIPPDHIQKLSAGAYGDVSVQSRSTLKLTSGTYFMASLDLEPQSKLVLDSSAGPIFLVVKSSLTIRGLFVDGNGKPTDASLFYFGKQRVNVAVPFQGSIVAPAAFLSLASAGRTFSGAFFAKDVEIAPRITLKH